MSTKVCGKIGLNFNPRLMGEMIRIGFPITIVMWIFILQSSADRVVSMSMLGAAKTGYYGLGNSIIRHAYPYSPGCCPRPVSKNQ